MFVDQRCQYFLIILDILFLKNSPDTVEEVSCDFWFFLVWNSELDHRASGVERFDNFVFEIAGEDEATVVIKCLNIRP